MNTREASRGRWLPVTRPRDLAVASGAALALLVVSSVLLRPAFPIDDDAVLKAAPSARGVVKEDSALALQKPEQSPSDLPAGRSVHVPRLPLPAADITRLLERGRTLFAAGDFAAARLLFQRTADAGESNGVFALATTYDPNVLAERGARGLTGEPEQAVALYRRALDAGVEEARARLDALTQE